MRDLSIRSHAVEGPLHLLRRNENGLTFALGYALARTSKLLDALVESVGLPGLRGNTWDAIRLQDAGADGITDIEIAGRRQLLVIEAKIKGWPKPWQLSQYSRRVGASVVVALGVPPPPSRLLRERSLRRGVALRVLRWIDVLGVVERVTARRDDADGQLLRELAALIREVIGMSSYDREVLVRDVSASDGDRYEAFLSHNLAYVAHDETTEPLFYAPHFTGHAIPRLDGIHYFARVYFRGLLTRSNHGALLAAARAEIDVRLERLRGRKTAVRETKAYLKSLPTVWEAGIKLRRKQRYGRKDVMVLFLGDPIRLPTPFHKPRGLSQLNRGFHSVTLRGGSKSSAQRRVATAKTDLACANR